MAVFIIALVALVLGILAAPLAAGAQQVGKVPVVGVLNTGTGPRSTTVETTRQGLRDLGYVEGQTIAFDVRFAGTKLESFPGLAADLVRRKVDVILVSSPAAIRAARDVLAAPLAAEAQQGGKTWQIGFLTGGARPADGAPPLALRQALQELGYVEQQNVIYLGRWADAKQDRLPGLAAELVGLKVQAIVTVGGPATDAAKQATSSIPIVMANVGDAVGIGLIESLARPGGNVTGITDESVALSAKRLGLLKEAVPRAVRMAVLWNADDRGMTLRYREVEKAAQMLHVTVQPLGVREPNDFDMAFSAMALNRPDALYLVTDALTSLNRKRVIDFAEKHRIPAMYEFGSLVHDGGLVSYGANPDDNLRRAAIYVDRIVKGAAPNGLPVERPTRYYLTINLKTAKALGLKIPQSVLVRADEVIQ